MAALSNLARPLRPPHQGSSLHRAQIADRSRSVSESHEIEFANRPRIELGRERQFICRARVQTQSGAAAVVGGVKRRLEGRSNTHRLVCERKPVTACRDIICVRDQNRGTSVGRGERIRTGSEVDRVLAGGRGRGYPVETLAASGVADAEIIIVARGIGGDDRVGRRRRNRRGLQLRNGELPRSWRHAEKNVRVQQTEDLREFGFPGYLALSAGYCHGELELAVELFIAPVKIDLYVLQHAELSWADARPDYIGAFTPYRAGAEA